MTCAIFSQILYQSRLSPSSIAVSSAGREVPYAEFVDHIERATGYLSQQSLPKNCVVAVMILDDYVHWLAVLALARLGITSLSISSSHHEDFSSLGADLILTDQAVDSSAPSSFLMLSAERLASLPDGLSFFGEPTPINADTPLRIVYSSGTMGLSKKVLLTHGLLQKRIKNIVFTYDISSKTRYLNAVAISLICGFHLPLATWSAGGTVIMRSPQFDRHRTILRHHVNLMFASPIILAQFLETMPRNALPIPDLKVFVGGSALPYAINLQARQRLTPSLYIIYGSTEASVTAYAHASIADGYANACGYVLPFVEVEVVDATGNPVTMGDVGEIRIRGEGCVSEYWDELALNTEVFRDGWFYPGDTGFLNASGMLLLVGRTGELMNLGGFKISPDLIERSLRDCHGVADIAAFAKEDGHGISLPWVCVVTKEGCDLKQLAAKFHEKFPNLPALNVALASAIPRNEMGKIQRTLLSNLANAEA